MTLALVVAVLALGGCGGGSDEESPSATSASAGGTAVQGAGSGAPVSGAESGTSSDPRPAPADADGDGGSTSGDGDGASAGTGSRGEGEKRGPRIAPPTGPVEQAPSAEQIANATVADMILRSPAILAQGGSLGRLAPTYTCDGQGSWPAFRWGGVPPGTAELALFAMNLQPVEGKIFFDWALSRLDPSLTGIEAGKLPAGAVVGTNGFGKVGYSLCPPPATAGETYMFALYALPERLELKRGFDPLSARKAALAISGNVGLLPAVYERG